MKATEICMLVFASLSIFLYAGAFYGWGPMQLLLEENGSFYDKCDGGESNVDGVCEEQTTALLNVRLVAQLTVLLSPVLGWISDRYGSPSVAFLMTIQSICGLLLLIFAAEFHGNLDWMLYLAFVLLGLAAHSGGILTMGTGMLFTGKARNRTISGLNALYDAGAVTYLGIWGLGELTDASLTVLSVGYLALGCICLGGFSTLLRIVQNANDAKERLDKATSEASLKETTRWQSSTMEATGDGKGIEGSEDVEGTTTAVVVGDASQRRVKGGDYIAIASRSVPQQLRSQPFIMLCIFFAFHVMSNVFTLTTARDFLKYLGDDDFNNRYLTIFTLMTPVSLVALPLVDVAMHTYGFHAALQGVNALSIANGAIKVSSDNLNIQVLGFVFFSFFRCFLFSVTFSCLPVFISSNATGRAVGALYVASGLFSFLNIPLANLGVEKFEGNFFFPNLIILVLNGPIIYVTWLIGCGLKREQDHASTQC